MLELPQTALMPEVWYFPEGGLIPEVWFVPHFAGARGEVDPCAICMVWAIPERRPHPYGYASDKLSKGYSYLILLIVTYVFWPAATSEVHVVCGLQEGRRAVAAATLVNEETWCNKTLLLLLPPEDDAEGGCSSSSSSLQIYALRASRLWTESCFLEGRREGEMVRR